jgi:hypothetical protein
VSDRDARIPLGIEFLNVLRGSATRVRGTAWPDLITSDRSKDTLENIGTLLSLLDRLGSCWWECSGGPHLLHYLVIRGCSTTAAGVELVSTGFYDEAISLSRNVAEVGNLLWLFAVAPGSADEWATADRQLRLRRYSPRAVRDAIDAAGAPLPIDQATYQELCELGPHVTPDVTPQTHAKGEQPSTGGLRHNLNSANIALAHLALGICAVAAGGARVVPVPVPQFNQINEATIAAIRALAEE